MGNAAVLDMKGEPVKPKAKKQRESICCIEERPRPDWFVRCKTPEGQVQWFIRISVTGLHTRRYGPFASKHRCLLFLDRVISCIGGFGSSVDEAGRYQEEYAIPATRFHHRSLHYPISEPALILHAPSIRQPKGGAA